MVSLDSRQGLIIVDGGERGHGTEIFQEPVSLSSREEQDFSQWVSAGATEEEQTSCVFCSLERLKRGSHLFSYHKPARARPHLGSGLPGDIKDSHIRHER